jgi:hypothetical protein
MSLTDKIYNFFYDCLIMFTDILVIQTIKKIYTIHSNYIDENSNNNDEFLINFDDFANN